MHDDRPGHGGHEQLQDPAPLRALMARILGGGDGDGDGGGDVDMVGRMVGGHLPLSAGRSGGEEEEVEEVEEVE